MNDALYEQLVSRRTKPLYYILLGGAFLLAVLIAVLGTMFFGVFSFIAGCIDLHWSLTISFLRS